MLYYRPSVHAGSAGGDPAHQSAGHRPGWQQQRGSLVTRGSTAGSSESHHIHVITIVGCMDFNN